MATVELHDLRPVKDLQSEIEKTERWARPNAPIVDSEARKSVSAFYHNINYRVSRKFINYEKTKIMKNALLTCSRAHGVNRVDRCTELMHRFHAMTRVSSNADIPSGQRKRDVGYIYHVKKDKELAGKLAAIESYEKEHGPIA